MIDREKINEIGWRAAEWFCGLSVILSVATFFVLMGSAWFGLVRQMEELMR